MCNIICGVFIVSLIYGCYLSFNMLMPRFIYNKCKIDKNETSCTFLQINMNILEH